MGGRGSGRPRELSNEKPVPVVPSSPNPRGKKDAGAEKKAPTKRRPRAASLKVKSPAGTEYTLNSTEEVAYYRRLTVEYGREFAFTAFSDLEALGRIILQETISHRYATCLAQGKDVHGEALSPAQESDYRKAQADSLRQVSALKTELGMHYTQRQEKGESPQEYMKELLRRAKMFGVSREKQLTKALVLFNEIVSNIEAFDRSNKVEREHLGFESEKDLVDWLRGKFPEFREIDRYFVENEQRYWQEPKNV